MASVGRRWRRQAGVGIGRQALASAGGGTVQSDQRRGASETGTIPTARVRHKERFRARPHPSPEPARWSACTSGRRAAGNRVSGPCPAARQLYWIGTATSGHHNVAPGSAQERSARGGAAAAVLGRHGGGCVAKACGSVASGGRRCGPKGAEGGVRKVASARGRRQRSDFSAFIVRGDVACLVVFFGGETSPRTSESSTGSEVTSRAYTQYPSPGRRQGR